MPNESVFTTADGDAWTEIVDIPIDEERIERLRQSLRRNQDVLADLDSVMKQRHLSQDERRLCHKPAPDWIQRTNGEECRSAYTLKVDDIIRKYTTA